MRGIHDRNRDRAIVDAERRALKSVSLCDPFIVRGRARRAVGDGENRVRSDHCGIGRPLDRQSLCKQGLQHRRVLDDEMRLLVQVGGSRIVQRARQPNGAAVARKGHVARFARLVVDIFADRDVKRIRIERPAVRAGIKAKVGTGGHEGGIGRIRADRPAVDRDCITFHAGVRLHDLVRSQNATVSNVDRSGDGICVVAQQHRPLYGHCAALHVQRADATGAVADGHVPVAVDVFISAGSYRHRAGAGGTDMKITGIAARRLPYQTSIDIQIAETAVGNIK